MSLVDRLFGKKKNPRQIMRQYKRNIDRTIRELDRERMKMQTQEKKLIREMKTLARQNQLDTVKIIAKDLIRTRAHVKKFYQMRAQMQSVSLKLMTMNSTQHMATAMGGVARTMRVMNARMNIPQMQRIMKQFARESEMFDMKEEMMSDSIDDVMEGEDEEAQENELVSSVLDEIGIEMGDQMTGLGGRQRLPAGQVAAQQEEDELESRLANLRGK